MLSLCRLFYIISFCDRYEALISAVYIASNYTYFRQYTFVYYMEFTANEVVFENNGVLFSMFNALAV